MAKTTLTICTTCRRSDSSSDATIRPGAALLAALKGQDLPQDITLRGVECLSACDNGCSMVLSGGDKRWTYVYGNLDPDVHVEDIIAGAKAYQETADGLVPWRQRPEIFRKQSIARIPPQD